MNDVKDDAVNFCCTKITHCTLYVHNYLLRRQKRSRSELGKAGLRTVKKFNSSLSIHYLIVFVYKDWIELVTCMLEFHTMFVNIHRFFNSTRNLLWFKYYLYNVHIKTTHKSENQKNIPSVSNYIKIYKNSRFQNIVS